MQGVLAEGAMLARGLEFALRVGNTFAKGFPLPELCRGANVWNVVADG